MGEVRKPRFFVAINTSEVSSNVAKGSRNKATMCHSQSPIVPSILSRTER